MQSVCLAEARIGAPISIEEETTLPGLTFGGYLRSKVNNVLEVYCLLVCLHLEKKPEMDFWFLVVYR